MNKQNEDLPQALIVIVALVATIGAILAGIKGLLDHNIRYFLPLAMIVLGYLTWYLAKIAGEKRKNMLQNIAFYMFFQTACATSAAILWFM